MAWAWVDALKDTQDNIYTMENPHGYATYTGPGGQSPYTNLRVGGFQTAQQRAEGKALFNSLAGFDLITLGAYGSIYIPLKSYFLRLCTDSQRNFYYEIYNYNLQLVKQFPPGGARVTLASDTSAYHFKFRLCMVVDTSLQAIYLGLVNCTFYVNSDYAYDNFTIYDYPTADMNLWDYFKDDIPSGGGGGDPYEPGGNSTSGGGENATFDLTSDNIDVPSLPTISASGAGLLTLYQVSLQNMRDFASYLWSPLFDVDTLKKLFNDPMDAIISLGMLPFTPTGGTASNIHIGTSDSGVSALRLASQYYEIDMGSVLLDTFYDSALDLNPYTKVDLYLPYCGTVSINPDEFDGKSIHIVYHVDILTGACVVFVEDGSRVLVQSQGNILTAIPFTAKDFKSIFGAVLGDAAAAGAAIGALATGGISAVAGGIGLVSHVALNTVNSKVNTPHGGQCASTAGFLSIQKPYLIITRPAQCLPEDNAAYQGYPAYITETVGNLSGFIKISEAHFDGFTCTDGELKEIDRLLKEGVYVQ